MVERITFPRLGQRHVRIRTPRCGDAVAGIIQGGDGYGDFVGFGNGVARPLPIAHYFRVKRLILKRLCPWNAAIEMEGRQIGMFLDETIHLRDGFQGGGGWPARESQVEGSIRDGQQGG